MNWIINYILSIMTVMNIPCIIWNYIDLYSTIPNVIVNSTLLLFASFINKEIRITRRWKISIYLLSFSIIIWNTLYIIYLHLNLDNDAQYFYLTLLYLEIITILIFCYFLYNRKELYLLPLYSNQL